MNEMAGLYTRWRRVSFLRGFGQTVAVGILILILASLVDYFVELPMAGRIVLSVFVYGATLSFAFFFWLHPTFRPRKLEEIAWLIERHCPQLNERLISCIELRGNRSDAVSQDMIAHLHARMRDELAKIPPATAFPIGVDRLRLPLLAIILFSIAITIPTMPLYQLCTRVLMPSPRQGSVGSYALVLRQPTEFEFIEGDSFTIRIATDNPGLRQISLFFQDNDKRIRRVRVLRSEGNGDFVFTIRGLYEDFRFWAKAGKVSTPKQLVSVIKRPKIQFFQIQYQPPAHTGLPDTSYQSTSGDLKGLINTDVELVLNASKALSSVQLRVGDDLVPVELSANRRSGRCRLVIDKSTSYTITLKDENGLGSPGGMRYDITMLPDQAPQVQLYEPEDNLFVMAGSTMNFEWNASDDFGIVRQQLFCDIAGVGSQIISLRPRASEYTLELDSLRLQAGDEVLFRIVAADALDQTSESEPRAITVVSSSELSGASRFRTQLEELQAELNKADYRLDEIAGSIRDVIIGQETSVAKSADLSHSLLMLGHRIKRLDQQLLRIITKLSELRETAFFPHSHLAIELMRHSLIRQTSSGDYHLIEDIDSLEEGHRTCKTVLEICIELARELDQHASFIIADTLSRFLADSLRDTRTIDLTRARNKARQLVALVGPDRGADLLKAANQEKSDHRRLFWALQRFRSKNDELTRKNDHIVKLIQRLDREVPPFKKELLSFAEQLRLDNRNRDWEAVSRLADAFAAIRSTRKAQLADYELLTRFLRLAVEKQSATFFELAAGAVEDMVEYHDHLRLQPLLSEKSIRIDQDVAHMGALLPQGKEIVPAELQKVEAHLAQIQDDVELVTNFPINRERLPRAAWKLAKPLRNWEHKLNDAARLLKQQNYSEFPKAIQDSAAALREAVYKEYENTRDARSDRDLARRSLLKRLNPPSKEFSSLLARLKEFEAGLDDYVSEDVLRFEQLVHEFSRFAATFQREAFSDITQPDGDVRQARHRMALAAEITDICDTAMKAASEAMLKIETVADYSRLNAVLEARKNLLAAQQSFRDIGAMMRIAEAWERGETSLWGKLQNDEDLDLFAVRLIPTDVLKTMVLLEDLRTNQTRVDRQVAYVRRKVRNRDEPDDIVPDAEDVAQRLQRSLELHNTTALKFGAQRQLQHAFDQLDLTLSSIRQPTMRDTRLSIAGRAKLYSEIRDHVQQLLEATAVLGGYRQIYRLPGNPAYLLAKETLQPGFEDVAQRINQPLDAATFAPVVSALKEIRRALIDHAAEITAVSDTPKPFSTEPEAPEIDRRFYAKLDELKHAIIAPETAASMAEELENKIIADKKKAKQLLQEVQVDSFKEASLRKHIRRQIAGYDRAPLVRKAGILKDISNRLDKEDRLKEQLQSMSWILNEDREDEKRHEKLRKQASDEAKKAVYKGSELIARLPDSLQWEIKRDCEQLIRHYQDNVRLADFQSARMNLEAMEKNIRRAARGTRVPQSNWEFEQDPAVTPERPAEWEGMPDRVAMIAREQMLEKADWHARRGLILVRAFISPREESLEQRLEMLIMEGDYEEAARISSGEASIEFAKSARLNARLPAGMDVPEAFQTRPTDHISWPRVALSPEAFDATASAAAIGNMPAMEAARIGDYATASQSMQEIAAFFDNGSLVELALQAGDLFAQASQDQLERLPAAMASSVRQIETEIRRYDVELQPELSDALLEVRTRDWESALRRLTTLERTVRHNRYSIALLRNQTEDAVVRMREVRSGLPMEAASTLEYFAILKERADELEEASATLVLMEIRRAEDALLRGDYAFTIQRMGLSRMAFLGKDLYLIDQVMPNLFKLHDDAYGRANRVAQYALMAFPEPAEDLRAEAKEEDYRRALRILRKHKDAALTKQLFQQADTQHDLLVNQELKRIENLIKASGRAASEARESLEEAAKLLRAGSLEQVSELLKEFLQTRYDRLTLLEVATAAIRYHEEQVVPLEEAAEHCKAARFDHAARLAARTRFGRPALALLRRAETTLDRTIQIALTAAIHQEQLGRRRALEQAAQNTMDNELDKAIARASAAGDGGKEAAHGFRAAQVQGLKALEILQARREKAIQNDSAGRELKQKLEMTMGKMPEDEQKDLSEILKNLEERDYKRLQQDMMRFADGAGQAAEAVDALKRIITYRRNRRQTEVEAPDSGSLPSYQNLIGRAVAQLRRVRLSIAVDEMESLTDMLESASADLRKANDDLKERCAKLMLRDLTDLGKDIEGVQPASEIAREEMRSLLSRLDELEDDWEDESFTLFGSFLPGRKHDYETYYRDANKKYLRWIARESRKSQPGPERD